MADSHDSFVKLANKRVNKIRVSMDSIRNLSNCSHYVNNPDAVNYYFDSIMVKYSIAENAFRYPDKSKHLDYIEPWISLEEMKTVAEREQDELVKIGVKVTNNVGSMKEYKFHLLMHQRMSRVVDMLNLIINLSNRSNYTYMKDEVRQIFSYLTNITNITKSAFIGLPEFKMYTQFDRDSDQRRRVSS